MNGRWKPFNEAAGGDDFAGNKELKISSEYVDDNKGC
jgi:hypothetical protein